MPEAFQYVRELADRIGPRPATTDAEAEAAGYIEDVFRSRGLDVERQEFDCQRTYSWAYVVYHLVTIIAAGALYFADVWGPLKWVSFVLAALNAFVLWMDLDTRGGLSGWLPPKGPSQNIVARRIPKARRGERLRKIVIVAHYDSAKSSLAFAPAMVKNFGLSFGLMKWCTVLVPVLILADNLPFTSAADPYLWYATLVAAGYLLIPLLINVHRELFMHFTDGANDNASGVAAMLGVLDVLVPEDEVSVSMPTQPITTVARQAVDSGITGGFETVEPERQLKQGSREDELLAYSPAEMPEEAITELPDDFEWAETSKGPVEGQGAFDLETEAGFVQTGSQARGVTLGETGNWGDVETDFDGDGVPDVREDDYRAEAEEARRRELFGEAAGAPTADESGTDPTEMGGSQAPRREEPPKRKGFFGLGRKKERESDVNSWLGVDDEFDAREEGRKIGSWESFEEEDDDLGFKGGWAGDDPIGDPDFAVNEAQRIRRRITERVDRALAEKEVWFVATGAEEVGTCGMKAFLEQYAGELRGAFIINLDNIGTGSLYWVTKEGMARRYSADRRLVSTARLVSREDEILVKGREYKGLSTDATPALARGFKAMSIMAFDINGRLPNWHWHTDTTDNVQIENIDNVVRLVTGMIREI